MPHVTQPNGPSPRTRTLVVGIVVALWGTSVGIQIASQLPFMRFDWSPPIGLNEIMTAVVMWMLARNHQATKAESDNPPPSTDPPAPQSRTDEAGQGGNS